ncbi:MAG: T9SS type A sorting domain-containing protein [Bacteroidota bacterium]
MRAKSITLLFIITLLWVAPLSAQDVLLMVEKDQPYVRLSNATSIGPSHRWAQFEKEIPLNGFTFKSFSGTQYTKAGVSEGQLDLFTNESGLSFSPLSGYGITDKGYDPLLSPAENATRPAASQVWYVIEGIPGSRIFKLDFDEVKPAREMQGEYLSFQIWLYESSGDIEYRYGYSTINPETNYNELAVFLMEENELGGVQRYFVAGDLQSPGLISDSEEMHYLGGIPLERTVYRFTGTKTGITEAGSMAPVVYPNPFSDQLYVAGFATNKMQLTDVFGNVVASSAGTNVISTDTLPAGVYFLAVEKQGLSAPVIRKVVKGSNP